MNKMLRCALLSTALLALSLGSHAQQQVYDESTVLLKDAMMGGIHIHPRGWGLNFAKGRQNTVDRMTLYQIEVLGMKHHKEVKRPSPFLDDAKGYAYGKVNSFYIIRPTIGIKRMITDKLRENGVELSVITRFGPSLGLTKPIYLEVNRVDVDRPGNRLISVERYDPEVHNLTNIYGKASNFRGLGELDFYPGLHGSLSMMVEYSPYQRGIKAVEAGINADYYFEQIPIMAIEDNKNLFLNFFVNVMIGKKYNHNRSASE